MVTNWYKWTLDWYVKWLNLMLLIGKAQLHHDHTAWAPIHLQFPWWTLQESNCRGWRMHQNSMGGGCSIHTQGQRGTKSKMQAGAFGHQAGTEGEDGAGCYDFIPCLPYLDRPHFFFTNHRCHNDITMTSSPHMTSPLLHYDIITRTL